MAFIDEETGEIVKSKFRSITDLKGFNDDEKSSKPSLTTTDGYESLDDIFRRCQRGELILQRRDFSYSKQSAGELLAQEMRDFDDMTDVDEYIDDLIEFSEKAGKPADNVPSSTSEKVEAVHSDSEADKSKSPAS